MKYIKNIHCCT